MEPEDGIRLTKIVASAYPAYIRDELESEGLVILVDALAKFDPSKGVSEASYIRWRLVNGYKDWLRHRFGTIGKRLEVPIDDPRLDQYPRFVKLISTIGRSQYEGLAAMLEKLPAPQQEVLKLFLDGHDLYEISRLKGRHFNSAPQMFKKACAEIRARIKPRRFALFRSVNRTPVMTFSKHCTN